MQVRIYLIIAAIGLTGCASASPEVGKDVQIANPASEHCVKIGGRLEIRKEAAGEVGYCHLPDGRIIEEWELFRKAKPDDPSKQSGMLHMRFDIPCSEATLVHASTVAGNAVAHM
ncbi:DUF333 domain-containing protein [Pseudomonas fluorescens]|jgi:hypothetical protein|uniref:putative hemolysin n=1 Tax=Pseudomonas fluorescens TaxID=294 RepID=UPI0009BBE35B|nr:DUF333 domain-containing protein [Pseudomonas fluorescens]